MCRIASEITLFGGVSQPKYTPKAFNERIYSVIYGTNLKKFPLKGLKFGLLGGIALFRKPKMRIGQV